MDQSVQKDLSHKEKKIYTGTPARVIKMLGNGLFPHEIARALGIAESYISQLKAEPEFIAQVNELVAHNFAQQSEIDSNYTAIEATLSKRLKQAAEMEFNSDRILRVLKFANEAKRKVAPIVNPTNGNGSGENTTRPVALILPIVVAREFILNPQNEVVGVNDQPLVTLPSTKLPQLVEKHKENLAKELQRQKEIKQGFKIHNNGSRQTDPYGDL